MKRFASLLLAAVAFPVLAWGDPPARVGRLSLVEGEASVYIDPDVGWEAARVNTPITSENSVWTEPGARAEVRVGPTAIRLAEVTQLDIARLDDTTLRAHVARGSVAVRIRDLDRGEAYFVTTPEARLQLRSNGRYRIDADLERGETRVTVFAGTARVEATGGTINIDTGRSVRIAAGDRARFEFEPAYSTAFDEWSLARDERYTEREAARYLPPEMTGWEDLDDYGVWRNEPEYGVVWFPTRVETGWAPYRYGRWTYVRPWGWTWVDDAPWGYAPFHYGRWVLIGSRWGWYPGRYDSRPVWAPALVAWIGGPGWNISVSTGLAGAVGWYPLSPFDAYQPWYPANVTYVTHVNRIVIAPRHDRDRWNERREDRHANREHGASVISRDNFLGRHRVQNVLAPVPRGVIASQPVVSGSVALPSRNEWRERHRQPQPAPGTTAPRMAPPREAMPERRPGAPAAPAPGTPATRFGHTAPAAPAAPAPGAPATRFGHTAPAVPAYPANPAARHSRPAPAEPVPLARPAERGRTPAPAVPAPRSNAVPHAVPGEPAARAKPAAPVQPARPAVPAQPAARPVAPRENAGGRGPQAVEKPAPKPQEHRPERPASRGGDRPSKPDDHGSGG